MMAIAVEAKQAYQLFMSGITYYHAADEGVELIVTRGQDHCYPWHMHMRHWTVGVIRHGAVWLTTETSRRRLGQGRSFCLRPYEPHSLHVEQKSSLVVLCIDRQGVALPEHSPETFLRHVADLRPKEIQCLLTVAASRVAPGLGSILAGPCSTVPGSLVEQAAREIMRLLQANPADSLRLEQMAAHAGYSPWYFLRAFQKMTGMTPHAFHLLCRLRLLRTLLRADTAAARAAASAGFADQSHMHTLFKRHHGMTPGAFKKASVRLER